MRNAALALLSLLVLGLLATNTRLRAATRLLEKRVAAVESKARPNPAIVREVPVELPPSTPLPTAGPEAAPPSSTQAMPVLPPPAPLPLDPTSDEARFVFVPQRVDLDLIGLAESEDPLAGVELTESQKALMESLKRTRDIELQPFKDKLLEIELRYEEEMQRHLTREQWEQNRRRKQITRLGATVYWRTQEER